MLFDIDKKENKIPKQKVDGGILKARKSGRPSKPNMAKIAVSIDKGLLASYDKYIREKSEQKERSAEICNLIRNFMRKLIQEQDADNVSRP